MIHTEKLATILGACALVASFGVMQTAMAGSDAEPKPEQLIPAQAEQFDDATIDAFAAVEARFDEIRALYVPQFEAAETEEQYTAIAEQATQEMIAVIEATPDITLEEYDAVIQAANQDPALLERINEAIENSST